MESARKQRIRQIKTKGACCVEQYILKISHIPPTNSSMDMITLGTQQFINLEFFLAEQQAPMVYWYGHQTSDQKVPGSRLGAATRIFLVII